MIVQVSSLNVIECLLYIRHCARKFEYVIFLCNPSNNFMRMSFSLHRRQWPEAVNQGNIFIYETIVFSPVYFLFLIHP